MESTWPFDQPENCAVISLREIVTGAAPTLLVVHNEDDHGWQFLGATFPGMEHAVLALFKNVVATDPTLYELADLPPGWQAQRSSVGAQWYRQKSPPELDGDEP